MKKQQIESALQVYENIKTLQEQIRNITKLAKIASNKDTVDFAMIVETPLKKTIEDDIHDPFSSMRAIWEMPQMRSMPQTGMEQKKIEEHHFTLNSADALRFFDKILAKKKAELYNLEVELSLI